MNNRGQMLMIAGLLMTLTLLTISISVSHSANLGRYQGERHDPAPLLTMLDAHLPPALDAELDGGATAEAAFTTASGEFENSFAAHGYALVLKLDSSSTDGSSTTFSYTVLLSDGLLDLKLTRTVTV